MPVALDVLSHRGPDNQAIKSYSNLSLGHVRLSIIDLNDSANQPMTDPTGRYTLVYNGEIYNFLQLRSNLELEGVRFSTRSDTEVLLHLLIRKGEEAVNLLNGFFAFIFYDHEQNKVLFARDRFGIKPLIYYEDDTKIILTSELNTLFKFDIDKTIDEDALNLFFRLTYMPAPTTILRRAYKILPGQLGVITEEGATFKKYYRIERQPFVRMGFSQAAEELHSRLTIAVKDRMISDVPVGTFLSGGLDSSIVSAISKKQKPDLQTFSIGFDHPYFNEAEYSSLMAKHIGSNHHEFIIGQKEFKEHFEQFLDAMDEPFGDSSAFAMYFLSKQTKKEVTVALSGDGADELFAGYRKHRAETRLRMMGRSRKSLLKGASKMMGKSKVSRSDRMGDLNRQLQKFSAGMKLSKEDRYFDWCTFVPRDEVYYMLEPSMRSESEWKGMEIHDMNDYLIADQNLVLPNDMLKKVDLMSMTHALEVRTPFLDKRVVEFANALPFEYKMGRKSGKIILKKAFEKEIPVEILNRKKRGFEVPIQDWLGAEINEMLHSRLFSKEYIEAQKVFDFDYIHQLIRSIRSESFGENIYLIWSLIVFQHWYDKYYE